jgi:predicted amidohydrolase
VNKILTIATCQHAVCGNVELNLATILQQIKTAKNKKAEIVHFPECSLTGYGGIDIPEIRKKDYALPLLAVEKVKVLAEELKIYVILGSHHFENHQSKPKNSLYVINRKGEIEYRYDKQILAGTTGSEDHLYYSKGDKPVIFEIDGIKCGLLICHEWRYPELYRDYKKLGAEIIFHSWYDGGLTEAEYLTKGKSEGELIIGAVKGYAANNYLWVSGSNTSKKESCFPCFVVRPDGEIAHKSIRNRSSVLVSKINLKQKFEDPSYYGRQRFFR